MSGGRAGLVRLVTGWLLVVVLTAVVTTFVVTRVGQDVAGELVQALPGTTATSRVDPGSSTRTRASTGTPEPSATDDASAAPAPEASDPAQTSAPERRSDGPTPTRRAGAESATRGAAAPDPVTTPVGPTRPEAGDDERRPTSSRSSTTSASTPATESFSVEGGIVTVRCLGREAQVRSVAPNNGYRFDVESEGSSVHVHFTYGSKKDEVEVSCRSGEPVSSKKQSGGDED